MNPHEAAKEVLRSAEAMHSYECWRAGPGYGGNVERREAILKFQELFNVTRIETDRIIEYMCGESWIYKVKFKPDSERHHNFYISYQGCPASMAACFLAATQDDNGTV